MASLESLNIAQQAVAILSNVRRDLLAECNALNARLDNLQWTAAFVASTANGVGAQLVTSLQRVADNQAAVESALVDWSVDVNATRADYTQLRDAANAMVAATPTNVNATLDAIIAQVPAKTRLF